MQNAMITYEQPLNEYIRVCLRLEHLFAQITNTMQGDTIWECRSALWALIEAINVIDRPDLKTKLAKALNQHASSLALLEEKPQVNKQKLYEILAELDELVTSLYKTQDKIAYSLRENSFLSSIRQHMASPGGACGFNTTAYELWLQKPAKERSRDLMIWFKEFDQLRAAVNLLLQLTRGSMHPQSVIAEGGFYQQALDANVPCQLIRVKVPIALQIYPEISVGRHRLSIRFYTLNIHERSSQIPTDVNFTLTICIA